jgi:hypothetical protein
LDLAGQQAAIVSHHFIVGLHLTQAQSYGRLSKKTGTPSSW